MAYFNSENIVSIECREKHIFLIFLSERLRNYKKLLACFFFGNKIENSVNNRQEIRFPILN